MTTKQQIKCKYSSTMRRNAHTLGSGIISAIQYVKNTVWERERGTFNKTVWERERESITWWSVLLMETTGVPGKNCSVYSQTIAISFEKIIRSLCNHIIYKHKNSPFLNFYFKGEASHISLRWWSFHVQDNFVIMTSDTLVFCKYRE